MGKPIETSTNADISVPFRYNMNTVIDRHTVTNGSTLCMQDVA
jgi:hypothetical protein